jgi:outer membrane protein assembly factor BamA
LQRRIVPHLYAGLNYSFAKLYTELDISEELNEETYLNSLGAIVSHDIRDNVYYPRNGSISNLKYSSFPAFLGNDYVSNKITLDYNQFFEMKNKRDIIACRLYGGFGIGELNFNQQFVIGNNDIRGYTQSKYRGDQIISIQGEYRWNPYKKLGFVGFVGAATVFSAINESDNGKILPGIGTGFRYNIFPKNHMNVGMDFAVGADDWGIYFKIGEAF